MRLGTYYRSLMFDKLEIAANKDLVLDVGRFDGKIFVKMIVYFDTRSLNGENGQLLIKMVKINTNCEE